MYTKDDYNKLRRLICHVIGTIDLIACAGVTDLLVIIYFADIAYVVHDYFKGYVGSATAL